MKLPTGLTLDTMYELIEATITQNYGSTIFVIKKGGANTLNTILNSLTHIYTLEYRCYTKFWRPELVYFRVEYKTWFRELIRNVADYEILHEMSTAMWGIIMRKVG